MYKKSRFTITKEVCFNNEHFTALFNTLNHAFVLLPSREFEALDYSRDDNEIIKAFDSANLILKKEINEQKAVNLWLERYRNNWQYVRNVILVTRKCNLQCKYCIIQPESKHMSPEIASQTAQFFRHIIESHKPMGFQDAYAGGEPLLNKEAIFTIAASNFAVCQKLGINYRIIIETNGTLLNPDVVKRLNDIGLAELRVSIAGPAQLHDGLRRTKQGHDTYQNIITNLKSISGLAPICIECQYDSQKADFKLIPAWMDALDREGIKISRYHFNPIHSRRLNNVFEESENVADISSFLNSESLKRGYPVYEKPPSSTCIADLCSSFVIDADGSILPCYNLQSGELVYGNVVDGEDFLSASQFLARDFPDNCLKSCEMLPLCKGGCRLQALIDTSNFNGVSCRYDEFNKIIADYIDAKARSALVANHV